jgi:putative flippase GtrA
MNETRRHAGSAVQHERAKRAPQKVRPPMVLGKAIRFALVGVVNASVDYGVYSLFRFYFGLPLVVANLLSWTVAVSGSYVMNSKFTFAAESGSRLSLRRYAAFVASQVGGLVANTGTVLILSYVIPEPLAKFLAIGVTFLFNFSLSHFVVFRTHVPKPDDAH